MEFSELRIAAPENQIDGEEIVILRQPVLHASSQVFGRQKIRAVAGQFEQRGRQQRVH